MTRLALLALVLTGCSLGTPLEAQKLTVACGMCIFHVKPPTGCYWAAEVGDETYLPVTGPGVPLDHDAHGPGGMCTQRREAVITGTQYGDKIVADRFELVPVGDPQPGVAHDHAH
ncbi:MAG: DUF6370 family protein [Myxococcota bacterium]